MTTKAYLVEGNSHKKGMRINLIKLNLSPIITIPICSNSKPIILREKKIVLYVSNLVTMHLNVKIKRETTILLRKRIVGLHIQSFEPSKRKTSNCPP